MTKTSFTLWQQISTIIILALQNERAPFSPTTEEYTKDAVLKVIEKGQQTKQFLVIGTPLDIYHAMRNQILGICLSWCTNKGSFNKEKEIHDSLVTILQVNDELIEEEKQTTLRLEK